MDVVELETAARPSRTLVTLLLSRTGSMLSLQKETIAGFNTFIDALKSQAGSVTDVTIIHWDRLSIDQIHTNVPVKNVAKLTEKTYQPRSHTPLLMAMSKGIASTESQIHDHPRIVMVTLTGCHENCSPNIYTYQALNVAVRSKLAQGWQFVMMGANIDAYDESTRLGIPDLATLAYRGELTSEAFGALARNIAAYANGVIPRITFSDDQKLAVGDVYDRSLYPRRRQMALHLPLPMDTVWRAGDTLAH